jgi:hypothetical protein
MFSTSSIKGGIKLSCSFTIVMALLSAYKEQEKGTFG